MKKLTFELGQETEAECSRATVGKVGQAAVMERCGLGSDERWFKYQLYHFLNDLEHDI